MMNKNLSEVITLDGPSSSGKSSVGKLFAKKIGFQFVDTGLIYRAGTYHVIKQNIPLDNNEELVRIFETMDIHFLNEQRETSDQTRILTFGEDVTDRLHDPEVSRLTPLVAAVKEVRDVTKKVQKDVGNAQNTVMAGRDIGSVIFPDAKLKLYITASAEARAQRRYNQLIKSNHNLTFEEVLRDTEERDIADSTRKASPMIIPDGAVIIDTTDKTVEESLALMLKYYTDIYQ